MTTSLLIVDDSTFSRNMIKRVLPNNWDVDVTEVICGEEALEVCELKQFDVIFLDLTMPDIDGLDVLLELNKRNYNSRVFIISADIQESSKQIAKERGAIDFFPKPIKTDTLLAMLQHHEVV
ncbi:response regulator [Psychromonas ossibalaenae]|uniref:response regulator n=1 Tax=Psychromonas ossibalaenae TaxID=444922 RepID=UPI00036AA327|nr:response regulator [Psychromonas ossibalaenae]